MTIKIGREYATPRTSSGRADGRRPASPAALAGSTPLWALEAAEVYGALGTAPAGLDEREVLARRARYGPK